MRNRHLALVFALLVLAGALASAAKYKGPEPDKVDTPYLMHADNLIETESAQAQESGEKNKTTYRVPGESSPVKTPLAEPIFLLKTNNDPQKLSLYPFEVKNGAREITFNSRKPKDNPTSIRFEITKLAEGLYKLEVQETLANGEYAFSPEGANVVFCFEIY